MTSHATVYEAAALYDLAFSYRDCKAEALFLRDLYQHRRGQSARSFLELAAGPGQHAVEMLAAGLDVLALDLAPAMAQYARRKAENRRLILDYVVADMTRFEVSRRFDLAACMLCSASYLLSDQAFSAHLRCVHAALSPDGMYVLELTHPAELLGVAKSNNTWSMRDEGGELKIVWGGDPAKGANGIWHADVSLCYIPVDGSTPVTIHDEANQRGFTLAELSRFAEQTGFAVEGAFGSFDEQVPLDDPRAHRMLLVLKTSPGLVERDDETLL